MVLTSPSACVNSGYIIRMLHEHRNTHAIYTNSCRSGCVHLSRFDFSTSEQLSYIHYAHDIGP